LRYFNVYGPRQSPDSQLASVVPRFIRNILNGQPPLIYGDGTQTRDFVFVKDVASVNLLVTKINAVGVYNIGSGQATSLNEVARLILQLIGNSKIDVKYGQGKSNEIKFSVADIAKAQTIGYIPRYTLEEGLKETIEYWKSRLIN